MSEPRGILKIPNRYLKLAVGLFACAALFLVVLVGASLVRIRSMRLAQATGVVHNLGLTLERGLGEAYAQTDMALRAVADEMEQQLALHRPLRSYLDAFVLEQSRRVPVISGLLVADAQGQVLHWTRRGTAREASIADLACFKALAADPTSGLVVTGRMNGPVVGDGVLVFARRINQPDSSFGGVVLGTLPADRLSAFFRDLDVGPKGAIILRDADRAVITHFAPDFQVPAHASPTLISQALQALLDAGKDEGSYMTRSALDGQARIFAFRRLPPPTRQILVVGQSLDAVLAGWRREAILMILLAALLLALMAGSYHFTARAWRLARHAEKARERTILRLEAALSEVRTLSGLLPICANCKKIRDDHGYWNQIEAYISSRSDASFSHGMCPECMERLYPEVYAHRAEKAGAGAPGDQKRNPP